MFTDKSSVCMWELNDSGGDGEIVGGVNIWEATLSLESFKHSLKNMHSVQFTVKSLMAPPLFAN